MPQGTTTITATVTHTITATITTTQTNTVTNTGPYTFQVEKINAPSLAQALATWGSQGYRLEGFAMDQVHCDGENQKFFTCIFVK